jgi:thiaminase
MSFTDSLLERNAALWQRMLDHPFLIQTRDGVISDEVFANWMRQDYLFVEAAIPMMGVLIAKAPTHHRKTLNDAIGGLLAELDLFRERAEVAGVDLSGLTPSFTCHAYIQYLMASVYQGSYAEGFTVLYAGEKAYHESWKVVQSGLDPASKWYPFVENWAGDAFAEYVAFLERELDGLAEGAGPDERRRMASLFEYSVRYEIAFWEMALTATTWPGV